MIRLHNPRTGRTIRRATVPLSPSTTCFGRLADGMAPLALSFSPFYPANYSSIVGRTKPSYFAWLSAPFFFSILVYHVYFHAMSFVADTSVVEGVFLSPFLGTNLCCYGLLI